MLSNISRILSRYKEDARVDIELMVCGANRLYVSAELLEGDDCKVSNRSAMLSSLARHRLFGNLVTNNAAKSKTFTLTVDYEKSSVNTVCIISIMQETPG